MHITWSYEKFAVFGGEKFNEYTHYIIIMLARLLVYLVMLSVATVSSWMMKKIMITQQTSMVSCYSNKFL